MKPLATKYRPTAFSDMVGQRLNAVVLDRMVKADAVPPGLLFSGPSGTGKTTAARVLATSLDPASDIIEIDAAANSGVDDIRALLATLGYSTGGPYRIVILDEAHSLTRAAFNALLKTLEEPPDGTIIVLVTTEPERIPPTVLSRLTEFEFRIVAPNDILDRLTFVAEAENLTVSTELLAYIALSSEGNVRTALTSLDQAARAQIELVADYTRLLGIYDTAPRLVAAMLTGDAAKYYGVLDKLFESSGSAAHIGAQLLRCLTDLEILKAGGELLHAGTALALRRELAVRIEPERLLSSKRVLWDLRTRVRVTDDPRGNLELAIRLIADVLTRGRESKSVAPAPKPSPVVSSEPSRKLSLSDIQKRTPAERPS